MLNTIAYDIANNKMRDFFRGLGFIEVPVQSRLSIIAACEDPYTVQQMVFGGLNWPLPQTGQMWLELELLNNPGFPGVYCCSTSYRDEPFPIPGRHDKVFPMFEFESRGHMGDLIVLLKSFFKHMGFASESHTITYLDAAALFGVTELEAEHEERLYQKFGPVVFLTHFPQYTHPFWNMKHLGDGIHAKVDGIAYGMEAVGSAERSINKDEMLKSFLSISDGKYSGRLFSLFSKERVMREVDAYLGLNFFPRFGAGIGVTRITRAMELAGMLGRVCQ